MNPRFLSVCSGIECASLAFSPLNWEAVGFAEIDRFATALLRERYGSNLPGEALSENAPPNFGDFTAIDLTKLGRVDVLCGGTPCQAFSVAGKRQSLADARGNLTLAFAVLAHELARSHGLRNVLWENVPGCLNTKDDAFGCFLGELVGAGKPIVHPGGRRRQRWPYAGMVCGPLARAAWRVFDAQHFGVPQRRARVYLVVDFGNGADPAEVLFERKSVRGDFAAGQEPAEGVAAPLAAGTRSSGGYRNDADTTGNLIVFGGNNTTGAIDIATACSAKGGTGSSDFKSETFIVAPPLTGNPYGDYESREGLLVALHRSDSGVTRPLLSGGHSINPLDAPMVAVPVFGVNMQGGKGQGLSFEDVAPTLGAHEGMHAIAFDARQSHVCVFGAIAGPLDTDAFSQAIAFTSKGYGQDVATDRSPTLRAMPGAHATAGGQVAIAFDLRGRDGGAQAEGPHDTANLRAANGGSSRSYVAEAPSPQPSPERERGAASAWAVRRLTPTECERLQGVPDDYTRIAYRKRPVEKCPDGPRYKALGNGWAVPVIAWIGKRLDAALRRKFGSENA